MTDSSGMVLVTGGTRGIGRAVCLLAAEHGYDVCFNYRTATTQLDTLVKAIEAHGRRAVAVNADLTRPDEVTKLFDAVDDLGDLSALVNNAGITGRAGPFLSSSPEMVREVFEVNVFALMECCRESVERMAVSRGGTGGAIVNLSSGAAQTGSANTRVWYGASKAAVETFTKGLAAEVANEGIRVNAISPGVTDTDMHTGSKGQELDKLLSNIPLARMATPEEIAEPVLWLLSPSASYVTGAVLRVGGGR